MENKIELPLTLAFYLDYRRLPDGLYFAWRLGTSRRRAFRILSRRHRIHTALNQDSFQVAFEHLKSIFVPNDFGASFSKCRTKSGITQKLIQRPNESRWLFTWDEEAIHAVLDDVYHSP